MEWFRNYLHNIKQYVVIAGINSIDRGVPQGSILGPLLYIIDILTNSTGHQIFCLLFSLHTILIVSFHTENLGFYPQQLICKLKKI